MGELVRTALITGGSRGIGKAAALRLAKMGYQIFLTYVSKPELAEQTCAQIADQGGQAKAFCLDIGDWDQVVSFFEKEIRKKVFLEVLVNNAGMTKDGLLIRMNKEQWEKVIQVNLTGSFVCLQQAAKIMIKQRYGRIINITSVTGQAGNPGQANYTAAKAGMIGLTKTAALELASRNITVNAVAPGFITTDMTAGLPENLQNEYLNKIPLQRFGTAEDIAEAIAFLASKEASYITGQVINVNGGMYL
ncbi:3-oxoacyl-[acyl-carrier-protein] reductase [Desulfohalobiaceae bacterium Ax17]|jgi:3-oxoacyl-[acyl-carrier protein] reductase|uniref:3-oxoacyl-[acyl-carrier-protein] reductase n=1 Tax=Desulfovulcanus ferrireducens TaxID=2831190 RepID=UPI00207BC6D2|nr:3-oxoacyl-[acyl-carrier-protein] reductase [Desulfovulcanus ferrireducens]MBT8762697.1 3-oxoacyl-[acyl-carrier-protein] reductase [Desulfovulcanus ferrireducens]